MDAVLNWLWQGCVVATAWFVMLGLLERAHANVRYLVSWAALLLVVALPALSSMPSTVSVPDAILFTQRAAVVSVPDAWWTSTAVMFAAWIVWATVSTVRLASSTIALRRARACSRAFPSNVESVLPHWNRVGFEGRRATLVLSDSVATAAVLGGGTPMIAVSPSLVDTLDVTELDRVLVHEWAHVQRRDDLINILQIIVRIVAGWHPAVWWIDRRLHVEREIACDEITVAITGSRKLYAQCLMKLASLRHTGRAMPMAPAVLTMSGLRARITKIVSPHPSIAPVSSRRIAVAIVAMLGVMSASVGGLKLVEGAAFALPFVSTPILSVIRDRAPDDVPTITAPMDKERSPRQTRGSAPSTQPPTPDQPSLSHTSDPEPQAPPSPATGYAVDSAPPAEADGPNRTQVPAIATVVAAPESPRPEPQFADAKVEAPRSPWGAAADGGVAIGRKSRDAGVATAGFFKRFASGIAGTF